MGSIAWPGVWGPDGSLRLRFWSSRVRPSARNVTTSLTDPVPEIAGSGCMGCMCLLAEFHYHEPRASFAHVTSILCVTYWSAVLSARPRTRNVASECGCATRE